MSKRLICCREVIELGVEKSSKEDMRFQKGLPILFLSYLFVLLIGFFMALDGIINIKVLPEKAGNLIITTVSVGVTVTMVYFIALQTIATRDMVKKAAAQAQLTYEMVKQMIEETALMNESLLEMKKQRLNIEEYKNYLLEYLRHLVLRLEGNATSGYQHVEEPYLFISRRYTNRIGTSSLSPAEEGFIRRVSKFIEKFLGSHGLEPQEIKKYNNLISNYGRGKDSKLLETIRERSKELLEITKPIFQMIEEMSDKELEEEILRILGFS